MEVFFVALSGNECEAASSVSTNRSCWFSPLCRRNRQRSPAGGL